MVPTQALETTTIDRWIKDLICLLHDAFDALASEQLIGI